MAWVRGRCLFLAAVIMLSLVAPLGGIATFPTDKSILPQNAGGVMPGLLPDISSTPLSSIKDSVNPFVTPPAPPDSVQGIGSPRSVWLLWNNSRTYQERDNVTDVQVTLDKGLMSSETLNFTQIAAHNITLVVEDYDPFLAPDNEYINTDEYIFMGFRVYGTELVRLDGFWVYLLGESSGLVSYRIYAADPYFSYTIPDRYAPIGPEMQTTIPTISFGSEGWVWLDADESTLMVDPTATEQNTFYLALWRGLSSTRIRWVYCYDSFWPDNDDEGDAWLGDDDWGGWDWSYHTRDYFLDVSIAPFILSPYPTDINLQVNGSVVVNQPLSGTGWWDGGILDPPINMTGAIRYYDVTLLWPDFYQWPVTFDVMWRAPFTNPEWATTAFQAWFAQPNVEWTVTLDAQFSSGAFDKTINITIEGDWNVFSVFLEGVLQFSWTEYANYILIEDADDGVWDVQCNAPNYVVGVEVLDTENNTITEANATDLVTIHGYVHDTSGVNATNGNGDLSAYDPQGFLNFTDSNPVMMPPGGVVEFDWGIWLTAQEVGIYTLQVTWTNGTEAGMNATTLTVWHGTTLDVIQEIPPIGDPVIRGEVIELVVNYTDYLGKSVDNATISVRNDTSGADWNDWSFENLKESDPLFAGLYYISLMTENALVDVIHNVTIHIVQPFYVKQNYTKSFLVLGRKTHILPLAGLDNSTGVWRTSPEPLINDTELQFTIEFIDNQSLPILFARIDATLHCVSYSKDLHTEEVGPPGHYNITVDTTPIQGQTFHEGDEAYIQIRASKQGFEDAISSPIYLRPQPRPSYIDIPPENQHIQLYANWTYAVPLRVILRDNLTGEDLTHGTVTADIPGIGSVILEKAIHGFGIFEIKSLDTSLLNTGSHIVVLNADADDYLPAISNVTLTILAKQAIVYTIGLTPDPIPLFIGFQFQPYYIQGSSVWLTVRFTTENGAPLPEGTIIMLDIWAGTESLSPLPPLYLDHTGKFTYQVSLDYQTIYTFYVTIAETENYVGLNAAQLEMSAVNVIHLITYLLPLILLAIAILVGSYLVYRQRIIIPRRRSRYQQLTTIADTFTDVANLTRLLILHKKTGLCISDPFVDESMDANLMAGFLQAISTFGGDLVENPALADQDEKASKLRELSYEGFNILINDGKFIRSALVLNGIPSKQLRYRLERFTIAFEERYIDKLEDWSGRMDVFKNNIDLIEENFHISLRFPHSVKTQNLPNIQLTDLEKSLFEIAKELVKDRDYIFLGQILNTYLVAGKEDKVEVVNAIYQLHQKELLTPWELETSLNTTSSTKQTSKNDTD